MKAKKSLGQHFLRSEKALASIVDAGDPVGDDLVLEIGPGEGVLTERLLKFAGKVVAVEKDDQLCEFLKEKFSKEIEQGVLDLIHKDILEFDPNILKFYKDLNYKIIANIPYNITGAILEKFLSADYQPDIMVLLVQREVSVRICEHRVSTGKRSKESILSISVKAYGTPRYVEKVPAGAFTPPPKVDSAIIAIENISKDFFTDFTEKDFFRMIRAGFSSKRKKLLSNLANIFDKELVGSTFRELDIDDDTRAEDLTIHLWRRIGQILLVR